MPPAPTPVPHVPMTLLKAGGGAMFSARCKALLAEAGYTPEDFGTYEHVRERCSEARTAVAGWDGQSPTVQIQGQPVPIEHARFLSTCQSGHLAQNACFQHQRGNPCSNFVDGHEAGQYPCMPHQGSATTPGTEHNRWTINENDQAQAQGGTNDRYPRGQMEQDANARTRDLLDSNRPQNPRAAGVDRSGLGDPANVQQGSGSGGAGGAEAGAAAAPGAPAGGPIDGETPADCINNFRQAGELAMRQNCADNVAQNRAVANGGPGRTSAEGRQHRRQLARERERAHAAREDARARAAADPSPENQAAAAAAERDYNSAAQRHGRARNAHCRVHQGIRIQAGTNRTDGRVPPDWGDRLPRPDGGQGAQPVED